MAGTWLTLQATSWVALVSCMIYSASLVFLFAVSAYYHVPHWTEEKRRLLRRLDHSAIFVLIAGTATPLLSVGLHGNDRAFALTLIWAGALVGLLQSIFWINAPKVLVAGLCVVLGWVVTPYVRQLAPMLGSFGLTLIVSGGIVYSLGAVIYALKRPNPIPNVFGYHEVFHAMVILAAILHFMAIYKIAT